MLAFGKSFLNIPKEQILNDAGGSFRLEASITSASGSKQTIAAYYGGNGKGRKSFTLLFNGKKAGIVETSRALYPIIFSSSNYNLFIESKPHIRKLMDRFIFGIDSLYIHSLLSYNKALKQKNFLLKTRRNIDEIRSWNSILSEMSEKITGSRMAFVKELNRHIAGTFKRGNDLTLRYRPSPDLDEGAGTGETEFQYSRSVFFEQFEKRRDAELIRKRSLAGPHLDRFSIRLKGKDLKFFSSGEKKIHLLMLYIAFIEYFKKSRGEYPVFLVDDFDTAMDTGNVDFLVRSYPELQMIATSVNRHHGFDNQIHLNKEN